MTLTTIVPSTRLSIPDPLDPDLWPAHTTATVRDTSVAGVSLTVLADVCGTPCVHLADSARPGSHGSRALETVVAVVVARVVAVRAIDVCAVGVQDGRSGIDIELDAWLGDAGAHWSQARLIGRVSTARSGPVRICADGHAFTTALPRDVRVDDLIALPCARSLSHRDVCVRADRQ